MAGRPLVIVMAGADPEAVLEALRIQGWQIVPGFHAHDEMRLAGRSVARWGRVRSLEDASHAVLAAVRGVGVICEVGPAPDLVAQLLDDLRQFGPVQVIEPTKSGPQRTTVGLDDDQIGLLRSLAEGMTLGEAATRSAMSRRTADRRLAAARSRLGASTTAEALIAARRIGLIGGR